MSIERAASPDRKGGQAKESNMTKKVNGGKGTEKLVKVTEAKALAMKVATILNGKPKPKMDLDNLVKNATARKNGTVMDIGSPKKKAEPKAKPKINRTTERRSFIKQNAATILKAWDALKGKKSGAALNRVLPGMHNKWIDEVLMLAGLRQSGEEVVIKAVAEDKPFLKDVVATQAKGKGTIETKKTHAILAPVVKDGGYTDEG